MRQAHALPRRGRYLVAAAVALLGLGAGVARAQWAAAEPVAHGTLRAGTVRLLADDSATASLAPLVVTPAIGRAVTAHRALRVTNAGNVPLDYRLGTIMVSSTPADLATVGLSFRVAVVPDVTACAGSQPGTAVALTTGTAVPGAAFVSLRTLTPAAGEVLCFSFTVPDALSASFRQGTAALTLSFHGQSR